MIDMTKVVESSAGWATGAISLAAFVFWLISFPMEGFLLNSISKGLLLYFLIPHAISLFLIARFLNTTYFDWASRASIAGSVLLTVAAPLFPHYIKIFLVLTGLTGAMVLLRGLIVLKNCAKPAVSAGIGIAAGNTLVFLLNQMPANEFAKFVVIAFFLLPVLFFSIKPEANVKHGNDRLYAPFLYVFYLSGGLMYAAIAPRYVDVAWMEGAELAFYVFTALISIFFSMRRLNVLFSMGVLLCMLSFAFYHIQRFAFMNLSMFAIQAAFGLVDLYMVVLLARADRPIRAFGYGFGTNCLAIICGKIIGTYTVSSSDYVLAAGNIILTVTVLIFYFTAYTREKTSEAVQPGRTPAPDSEIVNKHTRWFEKKLSAREIAVIQLVLESKTFKQVATELGISESSVKTYMKRAYEKTAVNSKEGLIALISGIKKEAQTAPPDHEPAGP
ncbi:MAG: LuxR family transcriptional regulator [Anaerolineaceae bacterium]|nr:MAG: LuxR family transcriptional regulator [Anaerolineaceae bacterium]